MNSPSPTSQQSVNLSIAISSALSRSVFASPTSPIKFGLLPSYPHILTAAALSPVPWLASALQMSTCTWHVPGVRRPSPMRAHQTALRSGSQRFPSFVSIPPCFRVPRGSCFPLASPDSLHSSGHHLLLPLCGVCLWQLPRLEAASCVSPALSHSCLLPGSAIFLLCSLLPRLRN